MARVIMKGDEAVAKAAIVGGCRYFIGLSHYTTE